MTKREWMARLKNYIQGLPLEEQKKIFDYYEELYADKRESGMTEWDIIAEFGNPQEVAGRMLTEMSTLHEPEDGFYAPRTQEADYGAATRSTEGSSLPPQEVRSRKKFSVGRLLVFLFVLIPCGLLLFALIAACWAVFLALTVSGVVVAVGGGITSAYTVATSFGTSLWLAYAGIGLAAIGAGIALTCICSRFMGGFVTLTRKLFRGFRNFISRRAAA